MPLPLPLAPLADALALRKGSLLVGSLLTAVFAKIRASASASAGAGSDRRLWGPDDPRLVSSLATVVDARAPWVSLVAQLVHFDASHLALNLVALWQIAPACEARRGSGKGGGGGGGGGGSVLPFLFTSAQLATLSGALFVFGLFVAARKMGLRGAEGTRAVGYSAVLFGWMALTAAEAGPDAVFRLPLLNLKLPALLAPLASIFAVQVMVPRASLGGHLAGWGAGLVVALGGVEWLTPGLLLTLSLWAVAAALFWRKAAEMEEAASGDPEAGGGGLLGPSSPRILNV